MNRPIKFRAWDVCAWTVPFTLQDLADGEFLDPSDFEKMKVVQFTGLLDKNGKEIYEGDIVMTPNYDYDPSEGDNPNLINAVTYRHAFFTYDGSPMDEDECTDNVEIIGNIYENPELLTN